MSKKKIIKYSEYLPVTNYVQSETISYLVDTTLSNLDELALVAAAYKHNRDAKLPIEILKRAFLDAARDVVGRADIKPIYLTGIDAYGRL